MNNVETQSDQNYTGKGYILKSYKGPRELYNYLWSLTENIEFYGSEEENKQGRKYYHHFITHIYASTLLKSLKADDFNELLSVPVYCRLIEQKFKRRIDIQLLKKMNIYKIIPHRHSMVNGKCREYILNPNIFSKAQSIVFKHIIDEWKSFFMNSKYPQNVNLFNGRPHTTIMKSEMSIIYKNKRDFEIPDFIRESLKSMQPCPLNPHLIIPYLTKINEKYLAARKVYVAYHKQFRKKHPKLEYEQILKHRDYKPHFLKYSRIQGLRNNILTAIKTISNQKPVLNGGKTTDGRDLIEYQAAYRLQPSGRVSEIHGGFQSLYTPCKRLLLEGVPNVYNYDMKNAQAVILADELRQSGYECTWLEDYLQDPDMKDKLSEEIGISVGCWKDCFYATIMGAETGHYGAIFNSIRKEEADPDKVEVKYNRFIRKIQVLLNACEKWRDHLLCGMSGKYMVKHKVYHWQNACGMKFREYVVINEDEKQIMHCASGEIVDGVRHLDKIKRELAAFFLQGREAFFIHNLSLECAEHGIPVYNNEHDGLITGKKIPSALIEKVARQIGLPEINMDIKLICKEEKMKSFEDYLSM